MLRALQLVNHNGDEVLRVPDYSQVLDLLPELVQVMEPKKAKSDWCLSLGLFAATAVAPCEVNSPSVFAIATFAESVIGAATAAVSDEDASFLSHE